MKKLLTLILLFSFYLGLAQIDPVNIGTSANDKTGDPLRTAFGKLNDNDAYLDTMGVQRLDSLLTAGIIDSTTYLRLDSLIDAGSSGTSYTFTKGLTESSGTVTLGGTITGTTQEIITSGLGANFRVTSGTTQQFNVSNTTLTLGNSANAQLSTASGNLLVTDSRATKEGIEYASDYSATFSDRSLADWGNVWKTGGTTTLKDNGMTIVSTGSNSSSFIMSGTHSSGAYADFKFRPFSYIEPITEEEVDQSIEFNVSAVGPVSNTFIMSSTQTLVAKPINYATNVSASFSDRSLADWGNVWKANGTSSVASNSAAEVYTASNAIKIGNNDGSGTDSRVVVEPFVGMYLEQFTGADFTGDRTAIEFSYGGVSLSSTLTGFVGIEYGADYSTSYTNRSLTDKEYVQSRTLEGLSIIDFPSTTATTVSRQTVGVTGAAVGDPCSVGVPSSSVTATGTYSCWVSAANTVTIQFSPKATEDPAIGAFNVAIHKP